MTMQRLEKVRGWVRGVESGDGRGRRREGEQGGQVEGGRGLSGVKWN